MLTCLWRMIAMSSLLWLFSVSTPIFANTVLPPLTSHSENLESFPNWKINRQSPFLALDFSPDGKIIASGSQDNTIRLWNPQSGALINTLEGHEGAVLTLNFSPDGKVIASGSADNTIRLWNPQSGALIKTIKGHEDTDTVYTLNFSPDGKVIASGSGDSTIRLWNAQSGALINTLEGHVAPVYTLNFSPDGKVIASGSHFANIRIWNAQSGALISTLEGHEDLVNTLNFSPDGKVIASGSSDKTIRLWNAQSGVLISTLEGHEGAVQTLNFSPDGKVIASGSGDSTIRLWNAQSGALINTVKGHEDWVAKLNFSPDGKVIASASYDSTIKLWNAQSGALINTVKGHEGWVTTLNFSPNGKVIASGSYDNTVRLWNAQSGVLIKTLKGLKGLEDWVTTLNFSPNGKVIASGFSDNTIRLWNAQSGALINTLKGHELWVNTLNFSPDGKVIASGSGDRTIRLWDAQSGTLTNTLEGHERRVNTLNFSPDGKVIASGSEDNTLRLWNAQSGQLISTLKGHESSVYTLNFSPDGKVIASGSFDETIRLWNARSGALINTLEGHEGAVLTLNFSPDGKVIASGSGDSTIRLWNAQLGALINTLEGHEDSVNTLNFSPDGKFIASGSGDGSIKLWKEASAPAVRTLIGGSNGNWLSVDDQGNFKRGDDGSLLLVPNQEKTKLIPALPKSIKAVPKESLSVKYLSEAISILGSNATRFKLAVKNNSQQPLLWLQPRLMNPKGFILYNSPIIQRLEPGHTTELTVEVAAHLTHTLTKSTEQGTQWIDPPTGPLLFEVVAPEQTGSNQVSVPVKVFPPKLELVSTEQLDNTLKVTVKNTGQLPVKDTRLTLSIVGTEVVELEEQTASVEIAAAGGILERAFVLPEGFKLTSENKINLQVSTSNLPFFIWNFDKQPIQMTNTLWLMLTGLLTLGLLMAAFVFYKIRYQHPMVLELSETPLALLHLPYDSLNEAERRLTQTSRLDRVLSNAEVSAKTLASASAFKGLKASEKAQLIADRLSAEVMPIQQTLAKAPDLALYQLILAEGFPLNIDRLLLCFPEATAAEDVFSVLKHHPEAQPRITLILGEDSDFQRRLLNKTSDTSNKWVAPQGSEVTRLLLAPDAETALAETLAGQLSLQQISPYRIGGGVNNESVFFGRRELISQIINRDPANYLIAGGRQVGKSTLLKAIERRYGDNPQVKCIYLTLSNEVLVPRLASLLKLERTDNVEVVATAIRSIIKKRGQRLVFLIDEADRFISQQRAQFQEIFSVFRRLSEEGSCTFILAGFWHLYQHATLDPLSPIYNFGELIILEELERDACMELVTEPMKAMNLSYANHTLVEEIVQSCGQKANLIAICCQHLVRSLSPQQRIIEASNVESALNSVEIKRSINGWITGENKHERIYEKVIVYCTVDLPSFDMKELITITELHKITLNPVDLDRALARLELSFVLGSNRGRWFYRVPLLVKLITEDSLELKRKAALQEIIHPLAVELSTSPSSLLELPIEQLHDAKKVLEKAGYLEKVLSDIQVSMSTLKSASSFSKSSPEVKAQQISKRLGAVSSSISDTTAGSPKISLFQLNLTNGFPLNIDRILLFFPQQRAPEDVFESLKSQQETYSRITLIVSNNSASQHKLQRTTQDTSNKWVAPKSAEITRLLLAPDAEVTLAEILANQLSLQQISPYRIGGGVYNESVFFGRRELISQIINRDPANYLVVGGRQIGKSTLLKAIKRRYEDNPHVKCVYINLVNEVLVPRLASFLKLTPTVNARAFAAQLNERTRDTKQRFVFLIDEADRFVSQEKAHDYSILNIFRSLSEEGGCTFILAGFWQLYQHAVLDYQSPIRNFGELLSVGELEKPACIDLVTQPMQTMNLFYANETLVEHIVDSCGQRANLIAIACQNIVCNLPPKQRVIEAGDVNKALRSDGLRRALSGWVVGETEHEQTYERLVVYATIGMPSFTTGELLELGKQHGVTIDTLVLDRTLVRMEMAFVLGRKDGRWVYRVPLFVDYIQEDSPELKLQAELERIGRHL